jgi:hypothetical protein
MQLTIVIPAVLALSTGASAWLQDEQGVWVAHATIHDLNGSKSDEVKPLFKESTSNLLYSENC